MKSKRILTLLIIIIIAVLGYSIFKKFNIVSSTPKGQLSDKEIQVLFTKVSKLINVPDETPVIATIIKADQLIVEQKFYVGSKDGDYLMVFPKAQKAIIYRENEDRLINVGPIIVDQLTTNKEPVVVETKSTATTTVDKSKDKDEE